MLYTSLYKFSDSIPLGITLERDDIIELANDEYEEVNNIRKNYCVTEKADGERNLLFINDIGEIYLGNRQNEIRKLGVKSLDYANTLLDGEYLVRNKNGKKIRRYLAFDLYFCKGEDFRERILMRSLNERGPDSEYEKSRLEELDDLMSNINLLKEDAEVEFILDKKIFKYGNVREKNDSELRKLVEEREEYLLNHSTGPSFTKQY